MPLGIKLIFLKFLCKLRKIQKKAIALSPLEPYWDIKGWGLSTTWEESHMWQSKFVESGIHYTQLLFVNVRLGLRITHAVEPQYRIFCLGVDWPTFAIDIKDLEKPLPNFQYGGWGSIPHLGFDIPYLNFNRLLIFSKSWIVHL